MAEFKLDAIKDLVEDVAKKIDADDKLIEKFKKEPEKVLKKLIPDNLIPDDKIDVVIKMIEAKIGAEKLDDMIEGAAGMLKGLFGRK